MHPNCIAAVTKAAGRSLTPSQLQAIEDRLTAKQRQLARQDPQAWAAKPADVQVLEAAQAAMQDIQAEAARKVENAQRQALKTIETTQRIADLQQITGKGRHSALADDLRNTGLYAESLRKQFAGQMMKLIEATASRQGSSVGRRALQFLFDAENPQMTRDLALEIFSQGKAGTGNQLAKDAAEAWLQTIEGMRQRFNDGGGDVGKLEYGYLPQPHDALRIRKVDADAYAQKVLPMLDRRQYVQPDGKLMTDAQVLDVLRAAHETLATDGLNKMEPGQFRGTGARANRGSESRVLHFRDGDAYLAYNAEFGSGGMYDAMLAHVGGLSKDIALVERMGPNPAAQFRLQLDLAEKSAPAPAGVLQDLARQTKDAVVGPEAVWRIVSGDTGSPQYARLAAIGMHIRNIQVSAKLGGAVISSITDVGTILTTAGFNKLPYWDLLTNTLRAGTDDAKAFANAHGMIADSMLNDLNRWQGEHIANNWSGRLANSVMKLSLMNAWTDTMRRGFSMTMMAGMGRMAKIKWDDLTEFDRWHMSTRGITADDWAVVNTARLDNWRGQDMLTPDGIAAASDPRAREVAAKVLGFIVDESETAVVNPDVYARAFTTLGGSKAGSIGGEFTRLTMQFKSFPAAMISRHVMRMVDTPNGLDGAPAVANKAIYTIALLLSTTALGAIAWQLKQVKDGKDPVDMSTLKFWKQAMAQGGGAGFIGDLVLSDSTDARSPNDALGRMLLGPTWGSAADLYELTMGNRDEYLAGKDTHMGAEAVRFAKGHAPLVNLWYTKAALDHLLLHGVQENLSPGYMERMKARARKEWDQDWYWEPGEAAPDRAPDFSAMGGE